MVYSQILKAFWLLLLVMTAGVRGWYDILWEEGCDNYNLTEWVYPAGPRIHPGERFVTLAECRSFCTGRRDCGGFFFNIAEHTMCELFSINDDINYEYLSLTLSADSFYGANWRWYSKTCDFDVGDSDLSCGSYSSHHDTILWPGLHPRIHFDEWIHGLTATQCARLCILYTSCRSFTYWSFNQGFCAMFSTSTQDEDNWQLPPNDTFTSDRHCSGGPYIPVVTCRSLPCSNGGTCTAQSGDSNSYVCTCATGWRGTNCNWNINECRLTGGASVCQNGGTCRDTPGSYTCTCAHGYTGTNCQTAFGCSSSPCFNNGQCVSIETPPYYYCTCPMGWSGQHCNNDLNECGQQICLNGGTCVNMVGTYQCVCPTHYTGQHCQNNIAFNPCSGFPCSNGGTCTAQSGDGNSYVCTCATGWRGTNCDENVNECRLTGGASVCQNGGTCRETPGSYTCTCAQGYTGTNCQTREVSVTTTTTFTPPLWLSAATTQYIPTYIFIPLQLVSVTIQWCLWAYSQY